MIGHDCESPLDWAIIECHNAEMIKLLLENGAWVHRQNAITGRSALAHAVTWDSYNETDTTVVTKMLLEYGSDPNSRDSNGRTPMWYAFKSGIEKVTFEVMSVLLDHGANIDQGGSGLLHRAAARGWKSCIHLLLQHGSDPNPTAEKRSLLSTAVMSGSLDVVSIFLNRGANVNPEAEHNHTPISLAITEGHPEIASRLFARGAKFNPNYIDKGSRSILSYAVESHSTKCVELVLEQGAEINQPGSDLAFNDVFYYFFNMKRWKKSDLEDIKPEDIKPEDRFKFFSFSGNDCLALR